MSDWQNPLHSRLHSDAPDAPPAKRRKPAQPTGKLAAKARRLAEREAAHARMGEILAWLRLEDDPLGQRLGRRLAEIESEIAFLDGYCSDRGRTDQRGALRPAYSKLNDLRLADVRECKPLLDRYVEIAAERRAAEGEPVVEVHRCPACAHTWTVNGRAQRFVCVFDDGEVLGSDPSGIVGVYTDDATADAALARQDGAGRAGEPLDAESHADDDDARRAALTAPGAHAGRPLPGVNVSGTPAARRLDRLRERYTEPEPAEPRTLADRWAAGDDLED